MGRRCSIYRSRVTMPWTRRTASCFYKWKIYSPSPVTAAVLQRDSNSHDPISDSAILGSPSYDPVCHRIAPALLESCTARSSGNPDVLVAGFNQAPSLQWSTGIRLAEDSESGRVCSVRGHCAFCSLFDQSLIRHTGILCSNDATISVGKHWQRGLLLRVSAPCSSRDACNFRP